MSSAAKSQLTSDPNVSTPDANVSVNDRKRLKVIFSILPFGLSFALLVWFFCSVMLSKGGGYWWEPSSRNAVLQQLGQSLDQPAGNVDQAKTSEALTSRVSGLPAPRFVAHASETFWLVGVMFVCLTVLTLTALVIYRRAVEANDD